MERDQDTVHWHQHTLALVVDLPSKTVRGSGYGGYGGRPRQAKADLLLLTPTVNQCPGGTNLDAQGVVVLHVGDGLVRHQIGDLAAGAGNRSASHATLVEHLQRRLVDPLQQLDLVLLLAPPAGAWWSFQDLGLSPSPPK